MAQLLRKLDPKLLQLVYFRPSQADCSGLDHKLFDLAAHQRQHLRMVVRHSDDSGTFLGGWVSGRVPTVLFVRNGSLVAQFVGDLPLHEIESLLRSALRTAESATTPDRRAPARPAA